MADRLRAELPAHEGRIHLRGQLREVQRLRRVPGALSVQRPEVRSDDRQAEYRPHDLFWLCALHDGMSSRGHPPRPATRVRGPAERLVERYLDEPRQPGHQHQPRCLYHALRLQALPAYLPSRCLLGQPRRRSAEWKATRPSRAPSDSWRNTAISAQPATSASRSAR